ncbi:MAG: cellobiose phosphorylase [Candidatus Omnitrophota bacterium]
MNKILKNKVPKYRLDPNGEFVIENYNFSKPFADFFPGIAGKFGIPMWVFFVNRGQAIASFGTKDKDHSILEFLPANKAWQLVSLQGFRTFIKVYLGKKTVFYEPFHNGFTNLEYDIRNEMSITSYDLKIKEYNLTLGLEVSVEYFTIPNDSYAALVRTLTVKNTGSGVKKIQILDGLPQIVPFGTANLFLKKLSRTIEAWMNVENLDKGVPFYKLDVDPTDRPEVIHIKEGNFYLGFHYDGTTPKIIKPLVNPQTIFGPVTDFSCPREFLSSKDFRLPKEEVIKSKTPCGMSLLTFELNKSREKKIYSLSGYMLSKSALNSSLRKILRRGYLEGKKEENKRIMSDLQRDIETKSSSAAFDQYAQQTYLDNVMRGGYPIIFNQSFDTDKETQRKAKNSVFYLYSRKHGDLERDYNKFQIQPTYFSQGNGNYRDMNQNRRCSIWFAPDIKEDNITTFFNLLQADGFNPLVVKGISFSFKSQEDNRKLLAGLVSEEGISKTISFLSKPFTPGELIIFIEQNKIKLKVSYEDFLNRLIPHCAKNQEAEHAEGFWIDHWTYNLDLLESYLSVYPEKIKEITFDNKTFTFYDNIEIVRPRELKLIVKDGKVRQLHSVSADSEKREMIKNRRIHAHTVRKDYGKGEIYETTLINKLLCLLANKLASLDPFGVGIEMEADKPNWFDALNGLPALLGSSVCETFELKRLAIFIKEALSKTGIERIYVTEEIRDFIIKLQIMIREYLSDSSDDRDYKYWDRSYSLKEEYRAKTKMGFSGKELEMSSRDLELILDNAIKKIDLGITKSKGKTKGIYHPYFINTVKEFEASSPSHIKPTSFVQENLPLFLESQMHALRLSDNLEDAKAIYKATKASRLYDRKLKMYKVTESLKAMPEEIGRCRVFSPGWLEHESIWLHMEYKYMLEVLKQGLYKEFYEDFKNVLIPFQNPKRYGRSILQNSSFLVSSAFADKSLHGNGFVARLSGSTAEFLQIWLMMNLGKTPFILNHKNELNLKLNPILPGWLFTKKDKTYTFTLLGKIKVTYHNPKRKDTFGKDAAKPKKINFIDKDQNPVSIPQDTIPSPYAEQVRLRQTGPINVYFD